MLVVLVVLLVASARPAFEAGESRGGGEERGPPSDRIFLLLDLPHPHPQLLIYHYLYIIIFIVGTGHRYDKDGDKKAATV